MGRESGQDFMSVRSEILIRVVDKDNASQGSFRIAFRTERALDDALLRILPLLINTGAVTCEHLEYDLKIDGVSFQTGSTKSYRP